MYVQRAVIIVTPISRRMMNTRRMMAETEVQRLLQKLHETSRFYPSPNHDCIPVRLSTLIDIERIGRLGDVQAILNIDIDINTRPCASNYLMANTRTRDGLGGFVVYTRPVKIYVGFTKSTTLLKDHLNMQAVRSDQWLLFYKAGRTPPPNKSCCFWGSWCSTDQSEIMA